MFLWIMFIFYMYQLKHITLDRIRFAVVSHLAWFKRPNERHSSYLPKLRHLMQLRKFQEDIFDLYYKICCINNNYWRNFNRIKFSDSFPFTVCRSLPMGPVKQRGPEVFPFRVENSWRNGSWFECNIQRTDEVVSPCIVPLLLYNTINAAIGLH